MSLIDRNVYAKQYIAQSDEQFDLLNDQTIKKQHRYLQVPQLNLTKTFRR